MSRSREFAQNTLILSIGKLLPKLCSFITIPILTLKLTKLEYGTYDLISTLIMLVIPIATLQIQSAAFRFLIDCRQNYDKTSEIITNIYCVTIPISFVASIIIQFVFWDFSLLTRLLIGLYFFLDTMYLTTCQVVRGLGKNLIYSVSAIILSVINLIGVVICVFIISYGLNGVIFALVIAQIGGLLCLFGKIKIYKYFSIKKMSSSTIKELLAYSWPMIPNNLSNWVLKLSDRLVITVFLGIEANAVYAIANKIPNLLSIAQQVMVMAWHENASVSVKDKNSEFYYTKMLDRIFCMMFGCTVLLIGTTPVIFKVLIRGEYDEAYYQMPILILAMFFYVMSSYYGGIYIAHKKTFNVGISTTIAAVINLVIDLLLIKNIGIWAASISTVISYAALYYYRMYNSKKFQSLKVDMKKQILLIFIMCIMLFLCFKKNQICNIINLIAGILLFVMINFKLLKQCFEIFLKKIIKNK